MIASPTGSGRASHLESSLVVTLMLMLQGVSYAQGTAGVLSGHVTSSDALPLPGATVMVTSPALQGTQSTATALTGDYLLLGLPPGSYEVTIRFPGLQTLRRQVELPLGGRAIANASLPVAGVGETLEVTASPPSRLTTSQVSTNLRAPELDKLPLDRHPTRVVLLSSAVTAAETANRPGTQTPRASMSGAFRFANLFLVDGVDVGDSLFGFPFVSLIEDAIEETQVSTSGISAEYGRFSGGVVNVITKSGGEILSGSFRTEFTNPQWTRATPFQVENETEIPNRLNNTYQETLGGPLFTDQLWFFVAGRQNPVSFASNLALTGTPYTRRDNRTNFEAKLTGAINPNHRVKASVSRARRALSAASGSELATLRTLRIDQDEYAGFYRGFLDGDWVVEAHLSHKRNLLNTEELFPDARDAPFLPLTQPPFSYNGVFGDPRDPEYRNNHQFSAKASRFFSAPGWGSHEFKAGLDLKQAWSHHVSKSKRINPHRHVRARRVGALVDSGNSR